MGDDQEPDETAASNKPRKAEPATPTNGRAKSKAGPKAKARAKSKVVEDAEIPSTVLAKAERAGLADKLQKLLSRPDVKEANISASKALSALENADGLLHTARRALLSQ